mgnify:CR=1 FL=1
MLQLSSDILIVEQFFHSHSTTHPTMPYARSFPVHQLAQYADCSIQRLIYNIKQKDSVHRWTSYAMEKYRKYVNKLVFKYTILTFIIFKL